MGTYSTRIDLTGKRFGRLTVIDCVGFVEYGKQGNRMLKWNCVCDCGQHIVVAGKCLKRGETTSCGCYSRERTISRSTKHGLAPRNNRHRLYGIYHHMIDRCGNSKNKDYRLYGGRGITVCQEWMNDFKAFYDWAIINGYGDNLTIDRINGNGGYDPSNCRWVTQTEQARNTSRNALVTIGGITKTVAQWIRHYGISQACYYNRIKKGVDKTIALTTPVQEKYQRTRKYETV